MTAALEPVERAELEPQVVCTFCGASTASRLRCAFCASTPGVLVVVEVVEVDVEFDPADGSTYPCALGLDCGCSGTGRSTCPGWEHVDRGASLWGPVLAVLLAFVAAAVVALALFNLGRAAVEPVCSTLDGSTSVGCEVDQP